MEKHYQTAKRTFVIGEGGICLRVIAGNSAEDRSHPAIGKKLLGSVANYLAREREQETNPPLSGQFLSFERPDSKKGGRIYAEAILVNVKDVNPDERRASRVSIHPLR